MKWLDKNNFFVKSHGLGNDYIVLDSSNITFELTVNNIRKICDVHYGIGSDGILLNVPSSTCDFGLRIFNPDGSEAEKSGNGLRIFSKYLYDYGKTKSMAFNIETAGGIVRSQIIDVELGKAVNISVEMGKPEFSPEKIPVNLILTEVLEHKIRLENRDFQINCVSMGNPHCVVIKDRLVTSEIHRYGSLLENHIFFPNRTNVQFAKMTGENSVDILIWERGAGYTEASGSSACATVAVLKKLGLSAGSMTVNMPGGSLFIEIDDQWNVLMTGQVKEIAWGYLSEELLK